MTSASEIKPTFRPPARVTSILEEPEKPEKPEELEELIQQKIGCATIPNASGNSKINASLAAGLTHGVIIYPGELYSFNRTVGTRTTSRGFKPGETIITSVYGPEIAQGVGGGICRTATAIHHAVLNAGLEVVERHNHSLPVSYADPGQDAAIVYGYLDYQFKNNTEYPVKIMVAADSNITVRLLQEYLQKKPVCCSKESTTP